MNIKKIAKKVYKVIKYHLIDKPNLMIEDYKMSIGIKKCNEFLDSGERYDPEIGQMIKWCDPCHISRYKFARKYLDKQDTVLDIACGTGYGTKILSSSCKSIIGVDISPKAIQYANLKYRTKKSKFILSDFWNNEIIADVVVSFETIEHIECQDIADVVKKLLKYCNKTIIGSVPYKEVNNNNKYHFSFNIDEECFVFLHKLGEIVFFYQTPDGNISLEKPIENDIQNLIFAFTKQPNDL